MKVALAYSGGLDTSVIVRWLVENHGAEVVTVTGDLGQKKELIGVEEKALLSGASGAHILQLADEFVQGYVFPALKAGALYEGLYPMATALGRPLLAKALVDVARREGCTAVAHGCTGKGNDQVRFEAAVAALAPDLDVLAPLRGWEFGSREDEIAYCEKHGIPVTATRENPYSIDENLWGTSIECGVLEDPRVSPPEDAWQRTVSPQNAPDQTTTIEVRFNEGIPVAVDGKEMSGVDLIDVLNSVGGANAIGRIDMVENRLVGIKSREIYEAPGAMILHTAHDELERLTLDRETSHYKRKLSADYADIVYNGLWFSPLRSALDAFINETQKRVSGTVVLNLYKGNITVESRWSPWSLYDPELATYTDADQFDHSASAGFIKIYSLPLKTYHQVDGQHQANDHASNHTNNRATPQEQS